MKKIIMIISALIFVFGNIAFAGAWNKFKNFSDKMVDAEMKSQQRELESGHSQNNYTSGGSQGASAEEDSGSGGARVFRSRDFGGEAKGAIAAALQACDSNYSNRDSLVKFDLEIKFATAIDHTPRGGYGNYSTIGCSYEIYNAKGGKNFRITLK